MINGVLLLGAVRRNRIGVANLVMCAHSAKAHQTQSALWLITVAD